MHKAPLSTIADINPPMRLKLSDTDFVSFVRMSDVRESGGITGWEPVAFGAVRSGYTRFSDGDVLFAKITPCMENGKGALALGLLNGAGCGSTEFHVLRAKPGQSAAFIYHTVQSRAFRQKAEAFMTGSAGQQRVPASFFAQYPVPIPDPAAQSHIAEILSTVDEAIEQTEVLIAKLQQVKAGLMHDLFTRGVLPDGRLRPPREEAPELYHATALGWLPRGWEVRPLRDYCGHDITYGIVQAGPHVDGGIPYVRTGDMSGDRLERASMLCTTTDIAAAYKRSEVRTGEIVCAIRATVGKVLPVPEELDGANLTQGTARIAPRPGVDADFLLWALRTPATQREVGAQIKGTTFAEITLACLRKLRIAAPFDRDEQALIAQRLAASAGIISRHEDQLETYRSLMSGLMQDLLAGPTAAGHAGQSRAT